MRNSCCTYAAQKFGGRKKVAIAAGIFLLTALISVLTIWMVKGGKHNTGDIRLKIIADRVDLEIKDVRYTEVGDPDLTWEILADTAKYFKKDNLAYFDRVQINLIRKDGKTLSLTGKEGILHTDTKDADIFGEVVVVSNTGNMFKTDKLHYAHGKREIRTDHGIILKNPSMTVSGVGMSLSLDEGKVTLFSNVKAMVQAENELLMKEMQFKKHKKK